MVRGLSKNFSRDTLRLWPADNGEALAIAAMRELRSLRLDWHDLDDDGLAAILDGCSRLESLDLRCCYCVDVYGSGRLRAKCGHVRTKKIYPCPCGLTITPDGEYRVLGSTSCSGEEYFARYGSDYFQPADRPMRGSFSELRYMCGGGEWDCQLPYARCYGGAGAGEDDDADSTYYFSRVEEIGFEEHDRILGKSRHRHLRI